MLYASRITQSGNWALERYDGTTEDLTLFHAVILAKLNATPADIVSMSQLVTAIVNDYPFEMSGAAISEALSKLEEKGYVRNVHEVTDNTSVVVRFNQFKIKTTLKQFWLYNHRSIKATISLDILRNELQANAKAKVSVGSTEIELRLI